MDIRQFKSHFYSGNEFIHLNNSGQAPIPDVYRDLANKWFNRIYTEGAHCAMIGWEQTEITRKKLAKFLGADESEISYFTTTSSALSQAAFGIPLKPQDEVLTWDQEYPSNFYPWRLACEKAQAKLIQVPSKNYATPVETLLERVNSKTKVIAISWVQYQTGSVTDLRKLSEALKGRGIWLVADVIQGAGVRPLNFHDSGFDILCGGSHKFMCSGYGAGFMALKKERTHELSPIEVGAMTFGTPDTEKSFSNQPKSDGRKYEPGTKSLVEIIGMGATLDLFMEVGIEKIYQEASRLAQKLHAGLTELNYQVIHQEGPILNFAPKDESRIPGVMQKLMDNKISFARRGPGIRLSTHGFNRDEEIERALGILKTT